MKNIKHILSIFTICLFIVGCDSDDNKLTGGNSDSGWVEFDSSGSTALDDAEVALPYSLPYGTNVNGLEISYKVELVNGDFPSENLGTFTTTLDEGQTTGNIMFQLVSNETAGYELLFTLLTSSNPEYPIGLSDGSQQITHTLTVNCTTKLKVPTAAFTGDYAITTSPLSPFGETIFNDQTVTLTGTGSERQFSVVYLADLGVGQPAMDFVFSFQTCQTILVNESQVTNLACSDIEALLGPDTSSAGSYLENDDSSLTISATEFYAPACGVDAPVPFTITLTKL
ncbi:hypothetical protein [Olleya sp. HaHaR_3_96]|uniref:hypothetical protein n=1 Tax=Olleya sp. HaHaR_3_96 TaxID=2745560 RepID=UPI001C4E9D5D|nr:hypothetical protein [Olleya sp. HaHaR_3_96]QXP59884.1 hypothetical protein H0I26_18565 [Olleya sp. HaHaR_3_96]